MRDALFQRAADGEVSDAPNLEVFDDLRLKRQALLIAAAVPRVGVGDVGVAQDEQVVALLGLGRQLGQDRAGGAVVVHRKRVGRDGGMGG